MDKQYEESLVRSFIEKRRQSRIIYELGSVKKRKDALSRLENVLAKKYMIQIPTPNSDHRDILNLLKSYGAKDTCYAISYHQDIDGQHLPIKSVLQVAVCLGMPSIISCIPNHLLYFESEQSYGPPARYILKRD